MNKKILIKKGLVIAVILLFFSVSVIPSTGTLMMQNETLIELIIDGPTQGNVGEQLDYIFNLTDPEGCTIWFFIDWDDGTNPDWFGPCMAGEEVLVVKTWYECGIYNFSVQVEGCDGTMYSETFEVTIIDNHPPDKPEIYGQTHPIIGVEYEYTFSAIDPDGDDIAEYIVNWGDDGDETITGPFASGEPATASHAWYEKGNYILRCKAKDIWGYESEWSSLFIWWSKNQQSQNIWLQRLCEKLPLLYRLVHILGWQI